ncbi:uncharacterized protein B0H18DRAFT_639126 [Fomitopsis serialis]|uniref:uncharacterized protein n=1 Tax=Fomitopsis serialis TaxID=139415 RepID=UPI0020077D59|nr:uncharacterized protein B0H18DRAFT_639126 [Neoantrodia serialis]KAH9919317.1 hypothetical protein B0H18DRAFT_639126 [Neoantrodia serialis]
MTEHLARTRSLLRLTRTSSNSARISLIIAVPGMSVRIREIGFRGWEQALTAVHTGAEMSCLRPCTEPPHHVSSTAYLFPSSHLASRVWTVDCSPSIQFRAVRSENRRRSQVGGLFWCLGCLRRDCQASLPLSLSEKVERPPLDGGYIGGLCHAADACDQYRPAKVVSRSALHSAVERLNNDTGRLACVRSSDASCFVLTSRGACLLAVWRYPCAGFSTLLIIIH